MEVLFRDGTVNHNCFTCSVGIGAADPCWAAQVHNLVRFAHAISIVTPLALSGDRLRFFSVRSARRAAQKKTRSATWTASVANWWAHGNRMVSCETSVLPSPHAHSGRYEVERLKPYPRRLSRIDRS